LHLPGSTIHEIKFGDITGKYFWSDGYSYGTVEISEAGGDKLLTLNVLSGKMEISKIVINGFGSSSPKKMTSIQTGGKETFKIKISTRHNLLPATTVGTN
jgi:non-lysosomal glucosylceramidase